MNKRLIGVGLVWVLSLACPRAVSADGMTWKVDGATRKGEVYAPTDLFAAGKLPLILAFHGHGDRVENFEHTNLHVAWPDAIVVYFQGLATGDGEPGWQVEPGEYNDRDLKLVDVAIAALRKKYFVDDNRIYATGFSQGAMFTYLLWAARPGVFAAYAPVAGRLRPTVQPTQPRPLFHVAGARDGRVLFADQQDAIDTAVRVNGVGAQTKACGEGCTIYGSGTSAPVMAWIHKGGHEYPQGTSERIVSFFRDHPRKR